MSAQTGRAAKIKITAASASSSTGEAMSAIATTTDYYTYRITDATKRHWNQALAPVLYRNTTAVAASEYSVNYPIGQITFQVAQTTGDAMTVDTEYYTASYLADARSWDLAVDTDMADVTTFSTTTGNQQWRQFAPIYTGATVDLGRVVKSSTAPAFMDRVIAGQDLIVELIVAGTNKYTGYGHISGDGFETAVDALTAETVNIQVSGQLSYSTY